MTDKTLRLRVADLTAVAVSALAVAAAWVQVAAVDADRVSLAVAPAAVASAPTHALIPALRPARRVVVVRRSRPS